MRFRINSFAASCIAATLVLVAAQPAYADPSSNEEAVAELIAEVAPSQGDVIHSEVAGAPTLDQETAVLVPSQDGDGLSVQLPPEAPVSAGTVTTDGTVVFSGGDLTNVDIAVQAMASGSVRIQTVINSPSSPHEFTYELDNGYQAVEASDGSIWAAGFTSAGEFQTYSVADAWARDAHGAVVPTHYEVQDGNLVQVISASETTAYPIVADPTWQWYSAAYGAGFSKSETRSMAAAGAVAGFCVLVPSGPLQVACGVAGAYWFLQAGLAADAGGCVFLAAVPAPLAMRWVSPQCK